jgi:hypothetical protein
MASAAMTATSPMTRTRSTEVDVLMPMYATTATAATMITNSAQALTAT